MRPTPLYSYKWSCLTVEELSIVCFMFVLVNILSPILKPNSEAAIDVIVHNDFIIQRQQVG